MITIKIFKRQDSHKKPKLRSGWRRPRGLQSKMRLGFKGYGISPSQGYGAPADLKYKHRKTGLMPVNVAHSSELADLKKDIHGVIISGTVGERKKVEILKEAQKLGLRVLNVKSENFIKKVEEKIAAKKKAKEEISKTKKTKLAERKKKAEEKEKEEKAEEPSKDIDKKKAEKTELDKVLTTKEN